MTDDKELYYLKSILRSLQEWQKLAHEVVELTGPSIASEVLADNVNWLECHIAEQERRRASAIMEATNGTR